MATEWGGRERCVSIPSLPPPTHSQPTHNLPLEITRHFALPPAISPVIEGALCNLLPPSGPWRQTQREGGRHWQSDGRGRGVSGKEGRRCCGAAAAGEPSRAEPREQRGKARPHLPHASNQLQKGLSRRAAPPPSRPSDGEFVLPTICGPSGQRTGWMLESSYTRIMILFNHSIAQCWKSFNESLELPAKLTLVCSRRKSSVHLVVKQHLSFLPPRSKTCRILALTVEKTDTVEETEFSMNIELLRFTEMLWHTKRLFSPLCLKWHYEMDLNSRFGPSTSFFEENVSLTKSIDH
ncbi:uncharacterized protein LOC125459812 [Stegostoma tigrinum]|uniref:uncharacterized protein LOC125459812 n=1 Tax=Stegostoma tigrinum TaxID=3053191 RepID=UPI00202B47BC|nr:uncharacterized protein LOC125459812 [Stegostoma tigrinum]XP_048402654.1 uncharacterized protein LOC125459812 [Stegostoma tigrinum]